MSASRAMKTTGRGPRAARSVAALVVENLAAILLGLLFLAPVVWMVAASLKPETAVHAQIDSVKSFVPAPFTLQNYRDAVARTNIAQVMLNTLLVAIIVAGPGLLLNAMAAYAFARMRFPGRNLLFTLFVASIILPLEVIVIPLFMTVISIGGWELVGERTWTIGALSVPSMAKAFNIFLLRQHFLGFPRSFEEAAFLDGIGWFGVFWRIALPNAKPALLTVVLLDFVVHWNDYLWPLVICRSESTRTVQLALGNFFTQPPIRWGAIMAYAVIVTAPLLLVFTVGQRWIVRSVAGSGLKQ